MKGVIDVVGAKLIDWFVDQIFECLELYLYLYSYLSGMDCLNYLGVGTWVGSEININIEISIISISINTCRYYSR